MCKLYFKISVIAAFVILLIAPVARCADDAPAAITAPISVKILALENSVSSKGDVSIYIMGGSQDIIDAFKSGIGTKIGGSVLKKVTSGSDLPSETPTILFVGDAGSVDKAVKYSRSKKIISLTNKVALVAKGVTLGIAAEGGKPKILLNLSSSSEEGLNWQPAIMKIAETIK